ncbi:hypothetical protein [uncultured Roseobacter sp.]|uniref:hypothetical protein n=1 Tax=uncultured Roseobacter sp. TaxID=114847 RepID=UPI0026221906|nr:hypothetical protein [uncultured Roseobacter sp.]
MRKTAQQTVTANTNATSCYPLTPHEMVTDDLLLHFAQSETWHKNPQRHDEYWAQLVMILPDLCGELLGHRKLAALQDTPHSPGTHASQIADAMAADDPSTCERAESIAQFAADEFAEVSARIQECEQSIARINATLARGAA